MGNKTVTMQLAEYSVADHYGSFTEKDIRMTKLSYIDWIAAAGTGVAEDCVKKLIELSEEEHVSGGCVMIGQGKQTSAVNAALINGTASSMQLILMIFMIFCRFIFAPRCCRRLWLLQNTGRQTVKR